MSLQQFQFLVMCLSVKKILCSDSFCLHLDIIQDCEYTTSFITLIFNNAKILVHQRTQEKFQFQRVEICTTFQAYTIYQMPYRNIWYRNIWKTIWLWNVIQYESILWNYKSYDPCCHGRTLDNIQFPNSTAGQFN